MANLQVGVAGNGTVTVGAGASVHSPASNELTLGTNGDERLRINSTGQLLWGIDNAVASDVSFQLHSASSGTGPILNLTNDTGDCRIFFGQDSSSSSANAKGQIRYNVANGLLSAYTSATERLRINSAGIVTSYATHPQVILEDPDGRIVSLRSPSTSFNAALGTDSNHDLIFYTNGYSNERLRINSSGRVNIGQASDADHILCVADTNNGTDLTAASSAGIQLQNKSTTDNTFSFIEWRTAGGGRCARIAGVQEDANGDGAHLSFLTEPGSGGSIVERFRLHSDGNIQMGTCTSIGNTAQAWSSTRTMFRIDGAQPVLYLSETDEQVGAQDGYVGRAGENLYIGNQGGDIIFQTNTDGGGTTERCRIRDSSAGIAIGGSGDANTLADYEEGTWTPTLAFGGGSTGVTYHGNTGGWYTKVGRMVTCHGRIQLTSKGSSSGAVTFGGLPFTVVSANSGTSGVEGAMCFSYLGNIDSDDGGGIVGGYASESSTSAVPFYVDTSGDFHSVEDFDLENTTSVGFMVTYCAS